MIDLHEAREMDMIAKAFDRNGELSELHDFELELQELFDDINSDLVDPLDLVSEIRFLDYSENVIEYVVELISEITVEQKKDDEYVRTFLRFMITAKLISLENEVDKLKEETLDEMREEEDYYSTQKSHMYN
tara:strand:+ start:161 stop:556 length:396 start_codon:yes stop_codon:yes gene_type:complete